MRIVALSDIHSNHVALAACLEEVERLKPDRVIFLGDYVSDCACPQKTMALVKGCMARHDCRFVRGNREAYMLDHRAGKSVWREGSGSGSLLYTYARLTDADLDFFESIPAVHREVAGGCPAILCCHGSPEDLRGVPQEALSRVPAWLDQYDAGVLVCGHSHTPCVTAVGGRLLVNAGSVGVPVTHAGWAQFALFESRGGAWRADIVETPFDIDRVTVDFSEDGFFEAAGVWPRMMIRHLNEGGEWGVPLVSRALSLARESQPGVSLADVPEALWQQAARELGIL